MMGALVDCIITVDGRSVAQGTMSKAQARDAFEAAVEVPGAIEIDLRVFQPRLGGYVPQRMAVRRSRLRKLDNG